LALALASAVSLYRIMMRHRASTAFLIVALTMASALADGVTVTKHANPVPDDIAAPVKAVLAPGGATAKLSDTTVDFWWVKAVDAKGKDWSSVPEGTLVGAMKLSAALKDIRGRTIKPGTYLLRYAAQPQNGDHLGISTFRDFLLLSPAAIDNDPKVLGFDGVVALSKEVIGTAHPASLSLDPPEDAPGAVLSTYKNEHGHEGVVLQIGTVKFGLIVSGLIVH
jgi:hypothetical protein